MLRNFSKVISWKGNNLVIVASNSFSTEVAAKTASSKHQNYVENLATQDTEKTKPVGWDEALPYEAIPGPKPLPILQNYWRFLPYVGTFANMSVLDLHKYLHKTYGEIYILKGIGRETVAIHNPSSIESLFRNEGVWPIRGGIDCVPYYRNKIRPDVFQGVGGLVASHGKEWADFRTKVNPVLMQPRNVEKYIGSIDNIADDFINLISYFAEKSPNSEMPEDFITACYRYALESIGVIALDTRLGTLQPYLDPNSEPQQFIKNVVELLELIYVLDVLPNPWKYLSTPAWRRFVKVADYCTEIILKNIEAAENKIKNRATEQPDHETSVLEKLIKIDKKVALTMAYDMLMAGIDTTGKTLGAALYYLARYPEKQTILRNELLKVLPTSKSPLTKQGFSDLPYLKAVVKEVIRMAPVAIGNIRTVQKDMVLDGYRIPKGSEVLTPGILLQHDDKHYPRANEFLPERWLRKENSDIVNKSTSAFSYMPFGFGPRSCVGKRLANLELEIAIAKIIRNFELSWPHEDMKFSVTLLYGIQDPLKLRVKKIE